MKSIAGCIATVVCVMAAPAFRQTDSIQAQPAATRPATTTATGDTGFWFVPTGEILPAGTWSVSGYRLNSDFEQGFTDVSRFPLTLGVGIAHRFELFGSFTPVTRVDRDLRPLFSPTLPRAGGVVNEYPHVNDGWSGNRLGDLWLGARFNVASQHRHQPVAFALRGLAKVPTANDDEGAGTGRVDVAVDGIVSKELNERVELSAFGGMILRGDPDLFDLQNGIRWGVGAGFSTRKSLRLTAELHGEQYRDDTVRFTGVQTQTFPIHSEQDGPVTASLALTWQGRNGLFAGAGITYAFGLDGRRESGSFENEAGDFVGLQLRLGYHPGTRAYVAPPAPQASPALAPAQNRPPAVHGRCEPCTVEIGKVSVVTADATDPDGETLTYRWSAASGTLANAGDRQTPWTAPMEEGPVPIIIEVRDSTGATATDAVTVQVVRPAVAQVVFEDVHFDFDRYSLRPEATRALDEAIKALQADMALRLQVEGHTRNIATAEYNLSLAERRVNSVRDYLTSRGVGAERLQSISYGEERPKHDNSREETRRLNRRAALVVRLQR